MSAVIDPYQKICKYEGCKKPFKAKRLNQDYHTPQCKVRANNGKASKERAITKVTDDIAKHNRRVLEWYHGNSKTVVDKSELTANGFDYTRNTGMCADSKGGFTIPRFYNYSLEMIGPNQYKINKL